MTLKATRPPLLITDRPKSPQQSNSLSKSRSRRQTSISTLLEERKRFKMLANFNLSDLRTEIRASRAQFIRLKKALTNPLKGLQAPRARPTHCNLVASRLQIRGQRLEPSQHRPFRALTSSCWIKMSFRRAQTVTP